MFILKAWKKSIPKFITNIFFFKLTRKVSIPLVLPWLCVHKNSTSKTGRNKRNEVLQSTTTDTKTKHARASRVNRQIPCAVCATALTKNNPTLLILLFNPLIYIFFWYSHERDATDESVWINPIKFPLQLSTYYSDGHVGLRKNPFIKSIPRIWHAFLGNNIK